MAIRFRLYSTERLRRERLLGEALVSLARLSLDVQREQRLLVILDSKAVMETSISNLIQSENMKEQI